MIYIFGASGFLGRYLYKFLKEHGHHVEPVPRISIGIKKGEWNFEDDLLKKLKNASTVINCVALTNLLECEDSPNNSLEVNTSFPIRLSKILEKNVNLIHISSDAMYESKNNFSSEEDKLLISNSYAKHKLEAENCIINHPNTSIIRTSFVGYNNRNVGMVNYFLDSAKNREKIVGWNDAYTSSLHISHVSKIISEIISDPIQGLFNAGTLTPYTKYEFLDCLSKKFNKSIRVASIQSPENKKLLRNKNLGMDSSKLFKTINVNGWRFQDVVEETFIEIKDML